MGNAKLIHVIPAKTNTNRLSKITIYLIQHPVNNKKHPILSVKVQGHDVNILIVRIAIGGYVSPKTNEHIFTISGDSLYAVAIWPATGENEMHTQQISMMHSE